jgi:hypothetical protein
MANVLKVQAIVLNDDVCCIRLRIGPGGILSGDCDGVYSIAEASVRGTKFQSELWELTLAL